MSIQLFHNYISSDACGIKNTKIASFLRFPGESITWHL